MDSDIKCLNYIVCTNKLFVWECKTDGICSSCIGIFTKKLNFIENIECPICFEIEKGVQQLDCNHYVCIKCFKRSHVFDWDSKQPPFPYPSDIEDEYEQNPNHPKWEND